MSPQSFYSLSQIFIKLLKTQDAKSLYILISQYDSILEVISNQKNSNEISVQGIDVPHLSFYLYLYF